MSCSCFQDTLHYTSPATGGWGLVRICMQLPESHQLFVCPAACGRHGALGAYQQGIKERLSYLYVEQSDIIDGYDDLIVQACGELLEALDNKPKVILIVVSCIDDLLGTNHQAITDELHGRHNGTHFVFAHMNPISLDSKRPPAITALDAMHSLLERNDEKLPAVNLVGCFAGIEKSSELYPFLASLGIEEIHHIGETKNFEQYKLMEQSRLNLLLSPAGSLACTSMKRKAGIPFLKTFVSYDTADIAEDYRRIAEFFGKDVSCYDFTAAIQTMEEAVQAARAKIGGMPLIVDDSCTKRPFLLAKVLLNYGFNVVRIFAQQCIPPDKESYSVITEQHPEIEIIQPHHHNTLKFNKRLPKSLALGFEAGYISASEYVVNLVNDDGLFGYDGVRRLMNMMSEAVETKADLQKMIKEYGLVI